MDARRTAQVRALGSYSLNLSVALFSLGVVAPLLEFGIAAGRQVPLAITAVMTTLGFAFVAIGVYLVGWAERLQEAPKE